MSSLNSHIQKNVSISDTCKAGNTATVLLNPGLVPTKAINNINEGDYVYIYYELNYDYFHLCSCIVQFRTYISH